MVVLVENVMILQKLVQDLLALDSRPQPVGHHSVSLPLEAARIVTLLDQGSFATPPCMTCSHLIENASKRRNEVASLQHGYPLDALLSLADKVGSSCHTSDSQTGRGSAN